MSTKTLPVELDYSTFNIKFGKAKISAFNRFKGVKPNYFLLNKILYGNNMVCTNPKTLYQEFTKEIGITPKAAIKMINNLGWKVIAGEFTSSQIFKYCYPRGVKRQLSQTLLYNLHSMKDTVNQALSDGQENLIPILLKVRMTPKEIKDAVGNTTWRKLTKISYTKAQYLSTFLSEGKVHSIENYIDLSTSYMANAKRLSTNIPHKVINRIALEERCLTKADNVYDIARLVCDTNMMAEELGYTVNPNWSWKRWQEEHKIITRKRRAREFSDKEITEGVYKNLIKEVKSKDGDKATLLTNPLAVAEEGDNMGHCVAGYSEKCAKGGYVVYHLELQDGTVGTLGCEVLSPTGTDGYYQLTYQQCYGKYNKRIDTAFAREVIQLNNNLFIELKQKGTS